MLSISQTKISSWNCATHIPRRRTNQQQQHTRKWSIYFVYHSHGLPLNGRTMQNGWVFWWNHRRPTFVFPKRSDAMAVCLFRNRLERQVVIRLTAINLHLMPSILFYCRLTQADCLMIDTTTFLFHGSSEISMNNYNTHTHAREITVVNFNVKQCLRCLHFDWLTEWKITVSSK